MIICIIYTLYSIGHKCNYSTNLLNINNKQYNKFYKIVDLNTQIVEMYLKAFYKFFCIYNTKEYNNISKIILEYIDNDDLLFQLELRKEPLENFINNSEEYLTEYALYIYHYVGSNTKDYLSHHYEFIKTIFVDIFSKDIKELKMIINAKKIIDEKNKYEKTIPKKIYESLENYIIIYNYVINELYNNNNNLITNIISKLISNNKNTPQFYNLLSDCDKSILNEIQEKYYISKYTDYYYLAGPLINLTMISKLIKSTTNNLEIQKFKKKHDKIIYKLIQTFNYKIIYTINNIEILCENYKKENIASYKKENQYKFLNTLVPHMEYVNLLEEISNDLIKNIFDNHKQLMSICPITIHLKKCIYWDQLVFLMTCSPSPIFTKERQKTINTFNKINYNICFNIIENISAIDSYNDLSNFSLFMKVIESERYIDHICSQYMNTNSSHIHMMKFDNAIHYVKNNDMSIMNRIDRS